MEQLILGNLLIGIQHLPKINLILVSTELMTKDLKYVLQQAKKN